MLEIFSEKERRRFLELLDHMDKTLTVPDLSRLINSSLNDSEAKFSAEPVRCPSCGRGYLSTLATIDGLRRRGCRRCYYSEVV